MMHIVPLTVLRRAASFELVFDEKPIYYAPSPYVVYVNGERACQDTRNVFSLFDLLPGQKYALRVAMEDGTEADLSFETPAETMHINVLDYGAVGDGQTDCTQALQAAIDACTPGGTVHVPAGTYSSYPLFIRSGILLYLAEGATLLGGLDREKYPILPGMVDRGEEGGEVCIATWEGNPKSSFASLVTMIEAEDAAIAGRGTIDGNAHRTDWWVKPKEKRGAWRPRTIFAVRCERITLLGITVRNSPSWTIHPYYSKQVDVLDIRIVNPPDSPNTDGCNPESCERVRILGAVISVGDDCISIKSGKYYMAQNHPAPSRDVTIRNCLLKRGHGAVVVGSEISAGVFGVRVQQCIFEATDRGLRIKTRRGRGATSIVDDVVLSDVRMRDVLTCFVINMFYYCDADGHSEQVRSKALQPVDELTPTIGAIRCERVVCTGAEYAGGFFYGLPENPIQSITMREVSVDFTMDARAGLPAMMDDLEPTCRLALFATNVGQMAMEAVTFTNAAI